MYGEGQRAVFSDRQIFRNWEYIPKAEFPEFDDTVLGIDFGYTNDPAVVLEVARVGDKLYVHEWLYKTGMTNRDLAEFLKEKKLNNILAFCDSVPNQNQSRNSAKWMFWQKAQLKGQGSINWLGSV